MQVHTAGGAWAVPRQYARGAQPAAEPGHWQPAPAALETGHERCSGEPGRPCTKLWSYRAIALQLCMSIVQQFVQRVSGCCWATEASQALAQVHTHAVNCNLDNVPASPLPAHLSPCKAKAQALSWTDGACKQAARATEALARSVRISPAGRGRDRLIDADLSRCLGIVHFALVALISAWHPLLAVALT